MDFLAELRKADERLAAAEPSAIDIDSSMVEEPEEVIAALRDTYNSLKRFETLRDIKILKDGLNTMKLIKEKVAILSDHVATWLSYHDNDGFVNGTDDVNKVSTGHVSRIRLNSLEQTTNFTVRMSVAAEICEISDVLFSIDATVNECCEELDTVSQAAHRKQSASKHVQIPETASPQAPIYCDDDIALNQKLSRLRALTKALQQSMQFIPSRMETLQSRALNLLPEAFNNLTTQFDLLNTRIQTLHKDFEAIDSCLTHDSWIPIIAESGDPRIKNYAKVRGFCDVSPEKPGPVAIALFRGLKPSRTKLGPFLPVIPPPSPPSFSSGSDSHSTVASFDSSDEELDFFATSPLNGKGGPHSGLYGGSLYISRIRKGRQSKLMKPTEIIKGQFARRTVQYVPVPIPKPSSRLLPPTPCNVGVTPLLRRYTSLEFRYQQIYSGIPTPRCSSLCTK